MEVFSLTLNQMLVMFIFIFLGFILGKGKILPKQTALTLSRLETYLFVPALNLSNMLTNCTLATFKENSIFILYGFILVVVAIVFSYPISKLFIRDYDKSPERAYQRNIYKYAITFGNYGFVGNFLVLSIWGSTGLFKYQMLTLLPGIACTAWGLYVLIPHDKNSNHPFKNFLTPPLIALIFGVVGGFLGLKNILPEFVLTVLSNASSCMGPVAMVLAGFVISGYEFRGLLYDKKVYIVSLLRLIVIPATMMLVLHFLGTNKEIMTYALILFATPLGLNTIVYPAAFGGDTKTGASMAMISHTFSVVTIPLMYLLFIVLL